MCLWLWHMTVQTISSSGPSCLDGFWEPKGNQEKVITVTALKALLAQSIHACPPPLDLPKPAHGPGPHFNPSGPSAAPQQGWSPAPSCPALCRTDSCNVHLLMLSFLLWPNSSPIQEGDRGRCSACTGILSSDSRSSPHLKQCHLSTLKHSLKPQ